MPFVIKSFSFPTVYVFADYLENHVLESSLHSHCVKRWFRYVDDILCLWDGSKEDLENFFDALNNFHPAIKFTMEIGGGTINYLDLTIKLDPVPDSEMLSPNFGIFQKSSYTGISICNSSLHPRQQKLAVIHSAIHRLLSIPLSQKAFEDETHFIEHLAFYNGLKINVKKMIKRKRLRKLLSEPILPLQNNDNPDHNQNGISNLNNPPTTRQRWIRLTYLGKSTDLLAKELKKYGYRTGFNTLSNLRHLSRLKDPIPEEEKGGVYKLSCNCGKIYIGQSGRSIKQRIYEHKLDYRNLAGLKQTPPSFKDKKEISAFAKHCANSGHKFEESTVKLIHHASKGANLNRLEEFETIRASKNNGQNVLNDLSATFLNPLTCFILDY